MDSVQSYTVTLVNPKSNQESSIRVREDEFIYDAAAAQGVKIPVSCCAGSCLTCTGKILEGNIEQDSHFLKPKEVDAGFVLVCSAKARSDCKIVTHQEDAILDL